MAPASDYIQMNVTEHAWLDRACDQMSALLSRDEFDKGAATGILGDLKAAMLLHYAEEEEIMRKLRYHNLGGHKRSHDHFLSEVSKYISQLAAGSTPLSGDDWADMRRRLDSHVRSHDHSLAEFMAASCGTETA